MAIIPSIKIIAMDFDHTLIDYSQGCPYIPADTQKLLVDLIGKGVEVGIVSGRHWWEMADILERCGMIWGQPFPSFVVTREAFIYRINKGRMAPDHEWNKNQSSGVSSVMCAISEKLRNILSRLRKKELVPSRWVLYSDYALELHFSTEEEAGKACSLLEELIEDIPMTKVHRNKACSNIIYSGAGKGTSLMRFTESCGLKPQQVLAIGDSMNDLDMLDGKQCFTNGAVGNAHETVKEIVSETGGIVASGHAGSGLKEIILDYMKRGCL